MEPTKLWSNGRWEKAEEISPLKSPYSGELIGEIGQASSAQMLDAISAAQTAFSTFKKFPIYKVAGYIKKISDYITQNSEEFAKTIALESAKPIRQAKAEVSRSLHTLEDAFQECSKQEGSVIPMSQRPYGENFSGIEQRFPLGVLSAITPFNFPLNLVLHKIAPAIASKNTMVLKPAPQTPLTSLLIAKAIEYAEVPPGVVNILPCSVDVASHLVTDERIKLLSFTGSHQVGWALKSKASNKKVCLECGGNAAVIVHEDADLKEAVTQCVRGGFSYSGQTCISVQRIVVHDKVYESFVDQLVKETSQLKVGDPFDESSDLSCMISEAAAVKVEEILKEAVDSGAKILLGGDRNGAVLQPTIVINTNPEMRINQEELFAPVVTVRSVSSFSEGIERVNHSKFGLQAGVFTQDINRARHAFEELDVGGVMINHVPTWRMDHMPYGGTKLSGNTREGVKYTMLEMTEPKLMVTHYEDN